MVRSFFLTSVLPFPTLGGADLRAWNIIQGLASLGPTSVFAFADRPSSRPQLDGLARWDASPALTPAEVGTRHQRMWAAPKNGTQLSDAYHEEMTERLLAAALTEDQPHVIVLDALHAGSYLKVIGKHQSATAEPARIVHNSHNVEAPLARQIADAETVMPLRVLRKVLAASTERAEHDILDTSDELWACSEVDVSGFSTHYGWNGPSVVVPNVVDTASYRDAFRQHVDHPGTGMVFPATFSYPPNEVGARFLLDEITPRLPDIPLVLPGAGPPPSLVAAADGKATVTGAVPDMRPFLADAAVMVVPLFEGGGTRLKVLEGFAAGLPVVATEKAVEGLAADDDVHLLLAETPDEFASAIRRASEPAVAARLRDAASALVESRYSVSAVSSVLNAALS